MKRIIYSALLIAGMLSLQTCAELGTIVNNSGIVNAPLTDGDIANGLKEALNSGVSNGVNELIKTDGYFGNQALKILLPPEASKVQSIIEKNIPGGKKLMDDAVLKMNRAAEDAANEAKPIFVNAITSMTITDARNILFGNDNAATSYLKQKTFQQLVNAYSPKINNSMNKVGANQAWSALVNPYNKVAGTPVGNAFGAKTPINDDLGAYVTQRALDGLFHKITEKELDIRKNLSARSTALLQRVFGELDKKK